MKSGIAVGFIGGIGMGISATIVMVLSIITGWLVGLPSLETVVIISIGINVI